MKKILLIFLLMIAIIWSAFIFVKKFPDRKFPEEIRSFETINLKISGMRGAREYEIIRKGDKTEISFYRFYYSFGKEERRLEKSVLVNTEEIIKILNFCGFASWNGFNGEHPKNVSDGEMFRLEAFINENKRIYAEGSANFPKGYSEFVKELNKLLDDN